MSETICLTQYSHGAGCGCKISPRILDTILHSQLKLPVDPRLIVGNESRDDAAVYDLGDGTGIISTTDFFMPIVDDPTTFGRIAATNAISDIYAMGGEPLMAIAIFGWPLDKLPAEVGRLVVEGGRIACRDAGIPLAGGHSIDAPEPIFGLAVTGRIALNQVKRNDTATVGCELFLTKPLGIGILSTAQKKKLLLPEHASIAPELMCTLNKIGSEFAKQSAVKAMTDVTGFGLLGHLVEVCDGSNVSAEIDFDRVPLLPALDYYLDLGTAPGGGQRNFDSYGHKVSAISLRQQQVLCDPQTSGGLLVALDPSGREEFLQVAASRGLALQSFGRIIPSAEKRILVK